MHSERVLSATLPVGVSLPTAGPPSPQSLRKYTPRRAGLPVLSRLHLEPERVNLEVEDPAPLASQ